MKMRTILAITTAIIAGCALVAATLGEAEAGQPISKSRSNIKGNRAINGGGIRSYTDVNQGHNSGKRVRQPVFSQAEAERSGNARNRSNIKTNARYGGMQFGGANNPRARTVGAGRIIIKSHSGSLTR